MKFTTWNLSHAVKRGRLRRLDAWRHLANLATDVALVQEAGLPISNGHASIVAPNGPANWVTAVVTYGPRIYDLDQPIRTRWNRSVEFRIPDAARPGTMALAMVEVQTQAPIMAVSLYGKLMYADQSVLRAASDLMPVFDSQVGRRVLLGGDLNTHTQSRLSAQRRRAAAVLALLESYGLCNLVSYAKREGLLKQGSQHDLQPCPCDEADCSHVRTHRHRSSPPGTMANNDYLFATSELVAKLSSVTVLNGDDDSSWSHSDHAPIVAEFDL